MLLGVVGFSLVVVFMLRFGFWYRLGWLYVGLWFMLCWSFVCIMVRFCFVLRC